MGITAPGTVLICVQTLNQDIQGVRGPEKQLAAHGVVILLHQVIANTVIDKSVTFVVHTRQTCRYSVGQTTGNGALEALASFFPNGYVDEAFHLL